MLDMSTTRVAIVILNWNGIKDTIECIDSLLAQTFRGAVVVVDNGSTDKSVELLEGKYPKDITLLKQSKNLGYVGGVNIGVQYAIDNDYQFVAFINNDAVADRQWVNSLVEKSLHSKSIGIVTGLFLDESGEKIDTTGEQYSVWGLPFPRNRNNKTSIAPMEEFVFGATGGARLYRTEMLKEIGFFDNDFFAYYEDTDMCFRAQLAGWKIAYEPKAVAYHKRGRTTKKMPGFTVYQTFKNLPLLLIKDVPLGLLIPIGIRFYFAYTLMFFKTIAKGNGKYAVKGAWMAFWLGFKKLGERWAIQKNKRVSTRYIKSMLWNDLPPDQTGLRKLRKFFTGKS